MSIYIIYIIIFILICNYNLYVVINKTIILYKYYSFFYPTTIMVYPDSRCAGGILAVCRGARHSDGH